MADFKKLAKHISAVSAEDLKESRELLENPFSSFFKKLSRAMSTRRLNMPGTLHHEEHVTPESDMSDSSNEDKEEEVSRICIDGLMGAILDKTGIAHLNDSYRFGWYVISITMP